MIFWPVKLPGGVLDPVLVLNHAIEMHTFLRIQPADTGLHVYTPINSLVLSVVRSMYVLYRPSYYRISSIDYWQKHSLSFRNNNRDVVCSITRHNSEVHKRKVALSDLKKKEFIIWKNNGALGSRLCLCEFISLWICSLLWIFHISFTSLNLSYIHKNHTFVLYIYYCAFYCNYDFFVQFNFSMISGNLSGNITLKLNISKFHYYFSHIFQVKFPPLIFIAMNIK